MGENEGLTIMGVIAVIIGLITLVIGISNQNDLVITIGAPVIICGGLWLLFGLIGLFVNRRRIR